MSKQDDAGAVAAKRLARDRGIDIHEMPELRQGPMRLRDILVILGLSALCWAAILAVAL